MNFLIFLAVWCVSGKSIEPAFKASRDVLMLLTTRSNRHNHHQLLYHNLANLNASSFNSQRHTKVLIHGWQQNDTTDNINDRTVNQLLDVGDFNVIFIDWSKGTQAINYGDAAARTQTIGYFVASQLNWMFEIGRLDFKLVSIIGFSLGGHIGGFIGKSTRFLLNSIVALDPDGPLFNVNDPTSRVDAGDAHYVECLHTNGGLNGFGIGSHICHADFFANDGRNQSGCLTNACSHSRSILLYIESLQSKAFPSLRCENEIKASQGNCNLGDGYYFGGTSFQVKNIRGIFHFRTNSEAPFSQVSFNKT